MENTLLSRKTITRIVTIAIIFLSLSAVAPLATSDPQGRLTAGAKLEISSMTSSASYGTSVYIYPALFTGATLTPGTNITVPIYINNVSNLDAWEFKIKADPTVLKAVNADATPYWDSQQAQKKGQYIVQVDPTQGTDFVYWVSLRQPNGVIPTLTTQVPFQLGIAKFQVLQPTKDTLLHIVTDKEDPNFGTILTYPNATYIGYTPTDANFANVQVPWDVNWDLKVNLADLTLVGSAFGSTPGTANWNPAADVNGDGRVNITDLTLVASHFGQKI
jgi:hypothetical protein